MSIEANEAKRKEHDASRCEAPKRNTSFFTNRDCACFPCHEGLAEDEFNCLFCYCPLYALGPACGGDYLYLENGVKSCEHCTLPHRGTDGNKLVENKFALLRELAQQGEE